MYKNSIRNIYRIEIIEKILFINDAFIRKIRNVSSIKTTILKTSDNDYFLTIVLLLLKRDLINILYFQCFLI